MAGLVMKPSNFTLEYEANGGSRTETPDVTSFDPGEDTTNEVDVTSFSSPDNRREYRNGLIDTQDGTFAFNWEMGQAAHNELRELVGGEPITVYATYLEDDGETGEEIERQAIVKGLSRPVEMEGVLVATVTFRFTGAVTITPLAPE